MSQALSGMPLLRCLVGAALMNTFAHAATPAAPLTPISGNTFTSSNRPASIVSSPNGKYVYRMSSGTGNISQFGINTQTGQLSSLGANVTALPGAGNQGGSAGPLAIDPKGRFVFAGVTGGVASFVIGQNGLLSPAGGRLRLAGGGPQGSSLSVSPDGNFLYELICWTTQSGDPGPCGISTFSVDPLTGKLKQLTSNLPQMNGVSVATVLNGGGAIAVTPDGGSVLLTAGPGTTSPGTVAVYGRNNSTGYIGKLLSQQPTATLGPQQIAITGNGNVYVQESLYYAGQGFVSNISAYQFNSQTQTLSPVGGSPYTPPVPVSSIAIDPLGSFVYAVGCSINIYSGACPGNIWAYSINRQTGALTLLANSSVASGAGPVDVTVDPSARFVYTANSGDTSDAGSTSAFTTNAISITDSAVTLGLNNAKAVATLNNPGLFAQQAAGFYYSTSAQPAQGGTAIAGDVSNATLSATIPLGSLEKGTTYYVQAYYTTASGATYLGKVTNFNNSHILNPASASASGDNLQLFAGINNLHGQTVASTGFLVGTGTSPNDTGNIDVSATVNNNSFSATKPLSALSANTTYSVWPYLTTTAGEKFIGDPVSFTNFTPPVLNVTMSFPDITHVSFTGSVVYPNGVSQSCGFVYATHDNPTTNDYSSPAGPCGNTGFMSRTPVPMYTDTGSAFTMNTQYYVRSYMVASDGNIYYSSVSSTFTNNNPVQLTISNITANNATYTVKVSRINPNNLSSPANLAYTAGTQKRSRSLGFLGDGDGTFGGVLAAGTSYGASVSFHYIDQTLTSDTVNFTTPSQ